MIYLFLIVIIATLTMMLNLMSVELKILKGRLKIYENSLYGKQATSSAKVYKQPTGNKCDIIVGGTGEIK